MSRKKAAVEAIKAKKAQERAEEQAKAQAAKGKATSKTSKASKSSNASKPKLPPPALSEVPTSTGFVAAKRLEDATPEELERLRLTPDGRMFRREMLSSTPRAPQAESATETESAQKAGMAGSEATPAAAPLDPADWTARPHTSFKTRLYDQYARNSAARATLLDRFAELERERKEREEREENENDEDAAREASTKTETDEHEPPQPSDTEDAMTKTNRTASESTEANEDDETLDPRPEVHDGEVDLDDFDYNPEGLARMISDGYSDEEEEEEEEEDDEGDCASEDDEENKEDKVEGKAEDKDEDVAPAADVAGAPAASAASDSKAESKTEPKPAAKAAMKAEPSEKPLAQTPAKAPAKAPKARKASKAQQAQTAQTAQTTPKAAPSKETAKTSAKAESPKTAAKNATAKPQAKKAARQSKAQARPQSRQPKPAASAPKTTEPDMPKALKASNTEAKAPAIEPAAPVVTQARGPAGVVEAALEPVAVPAVDSAPDSALLEEEPASVALREAPATARAAESSAPSKPEKPEKPAKKLRDKTGRRAHGYADALRHAADVKAAAEARVEVSLGRTFDEIHDAADEDDEDDEDDDEETEAEIETMTPALRFSTANATLEADEPAPMLAAHGRRGAQGARSSRYGMLPEVERIDGRRATLPRNRTGKALPRITPLYADDPAPVDVGRAYLYAVDERARALMDEDADRLMEEGFRDRYVVRTEWDGPSPVENCLRLEAETPAILDAEAARRRARLEEEQGNEKADRDADGTIEGDAIEGTTREPRKTVRFGHFPFALLPGKRRARGAETMNATTATNAAKATNAETTSDKIEGHEARDVTEPADVAKARPAPEKDAVAEATEGNTTAGSVPAVEARSCSLESSADEEPAAHGARTGKSSNASDAPDVSNAAQGSFSVAASKAPLSRPSKTTVVLGLTALVASGLAVALAFTHPAVEAGVKKATEILKSRVPAVLGGGAAPDRLHPAILVVDRGAVEERAALARLAATRPGAQAARDAHEANAFASIDREAIDRAIEATAAENRAIVLDRRLVLAAAPEFALEKTTTSETSPVMRLDATPEVLRRLGLDKTDPAALERAVMEHWFPKTKEARGAENELEAATASESAGAPAPAAPVRPTAPAVPAAPEKTLRDLAALLLPEDAEPAATDSAAGFLPVERVRK